MNFGIKFSNFGAYLLNMEMLTKYLLWFLRATVESFNKQIEESRSALKIERPDRYTSHM